MSLFVEGLPTDNKNTVFVPWDMHGCNVAAIGELLVRL